VEKSTKSSDKFYDKCLYTKCQKLPICLEVPLCRAKSALCRAQRALCMGLCLTAPTWKSHKSRILVHPTDPPAQALFCPVQVFKVPLHRSEKALCRALCITTSNNKIILAQLLILRAHLCRAVLPLHRALMSPGTGLKTPYAGLFAPLSNRPVEALCRACGSVSVFVLELVLTHIRLNSILDSPFDLFVFASNYVQFSPNLSPFWHFSRKVIPGDKYSYMRHNLQ